ncbi:hypothetical protein [Runella salmonicolor]|uniref:Uncharacterized protein n=1 Tax=Runella salmonicolor TaxID=2950278 RepID=A0ABT1FRY3_9BACT|nr:hypothetical protein [Runella salmonicolor]MCP1383388.1 hypothetical protein [Runella salmonicolor]
MQKPNDDELFEVLDGTATEELRQRHQYWLKTDTAYCEYFIELSQLHNDLETMHLESPSMAFENNVIRQWASDKSRSTRTMLAKWVPFIFISMMLILTLVGVSILGETQSTNLWTEQLQSWDQTLNPTLIQQVLLPFNAVLFLLIAERILRKRLNRQP